MTIVHYEFKAFPAKYWPRERNRSNKGYRCGPLSTLSYDTLAEARREVKRLKRIYTLRYAGRPKEESTLWRYRKEDFLHIYRVETTLMERFK